MSIGRSAEQKLSGAAPSSQRDRVESGPGLCYLYGIARLAEAKAASLGTGVGVPPHEVFLLPFQRIAAVSSEVSADAPPGSQVRGLRRDMSAHSNVLNRLSEITTVLPVRFGVCMANREAVVDGFLRPQYERLDEQLSQLAGAVELTLHVQYEEEAILQEVRKEQPSLAAAGSHRLRAKRGFEEQMEWGRQIIEAVQNQGERDARHLLERLQPLASDTTLADATSELTVLKASFLVHRDDLVRFDRMVEELHRNLRPRMKFDYVGPLPPYSFTRVRLPVAE